MVGTSGHQRQVRNHICRSFARLKHRRGFQRSINADHSLQAFGSYDERARWGCVSTRRENIPIPKPWLPAFVSAPGSLTQLARSLCKEGVPAFKLSFCASSAGRKPAWESKLLQARASDSPAEHDSWQSFLACKRARRRIAGRLVRFPPILLQLMVGCILSLIHSPGSGELLLVEQVSAQFIVKLTER